MKVLIDARMYGLEHTGVGRYIMKLVEELVKQDTRNEYKLLLRKKYFDQLRLPKNWKIVLADFRHYTVEEQLKLPGLISSQKPDLVHVPHLNVPIFWKGKFVVTLHDMTIHKQGTASTTLPLPLYYFKRLPYKYAFRHAIKNAVCVITPTQAVKDELVSYFGVDGKKVRPIHMGLDEEFLKEGKNGKILKKYGITGDYFIYIGNVYPHKNLGRAIEALVLINKKLDKKVSFAIACSRSIFLSRLEDLVYKMNLKKYVNFLGFVPDDELAVLLEQSVAFIYPSLSEGFGLQGLESIAAGTLVLASDIPVFKEVYKDNVLYFNPFDFTSIEKSMREALEMSEKERKKIIQKGQKYIKHYSWSQMAKETLSVYHSVHSSRA